MKKRNIILTVCLIICIAIAIGIILLKLFNNKDNITDNNNNNIDNNKDNNIKENLNPEVISKKNISNLVFDNIKYTYDGEFTTVYMEVTNNNHKGVYLKAFVVKVYNKNNEILGKFNPNPNYLIEPGKTNELKFFIKKDFSEAYKMEIELPELEFEEE